MTPREFKAWFDGFTEAMDGKPTAEQWQRVKERVAEIDGKAVTREVFVDRYWPRPWRDWDLDRRRYTCSSSSSARDEIFEPVRAMLSLGRADASVLRA